MPDTLRSSGVTRRGLIAAALPSACVAGQYVDKRREQPGFDGPSADPVGDGRLDCVPIGFFGPASAAHKRGGSLYMGLASALEEANARGGYRGKPFELVSRWADDPWREGATAVVKLVLEDKVCAIVGGIDGATTHLAEQVVTKMLVPLVDPASTDQTVNQVGVAWMFSCAPGDPEIAAAMVADMKSRPFTLIAATEHDARNLAAEVVKAAARARTHIARRIDVAGSNVGTVTDVSGPCLVLAPPEQLVALAGALPPATAVTAGPAARSRLCARLKLRAPALHAARPQLAERLEARFSQPADDFSFLAYDAALMLVEAIREGGTERAEIRARLAPHFGPRGRRVQEVSL